MEQYKIVKMGSKDYDVKNCYYVLQLFYINKQNRGKYRLVKQCKSIDDAQDYIYSRISQD